MSAVLDKWRKENEPDPAERERRWREIAAKSPPALIIDEVTIGARFQLSGEGWRMADGHENYGGGCYWTEPAKPGEAPRTAMWRPDSPLLGRYRISMWYGSLPEGGLSANVPVTVATRAGPKDLRIDQTQRSGQWQVLGVFENPTNVTLSNAASGRVIVDAVRFERLD